MTYLTDNKFITALFLAVFGVSMGIAVVAEAQSRSARGVDMRNLQNQQANPCESLGKFHLPIHPNSDAQGCVDVLVLYPGTGNLFVGSSATFEEETTFEKNSTFNNLATFNDSSIFNSTSTFEGDVSFNKAVKIGTATRCTSADAGTLRYNSSKKLLEFCDGNVFKDLTGPRGPRGPEGSTGATGSSGADGSTAETGPSKGNWTVGPWSRCSALASPCQRNARTGTRKRSVKCYFDTCVGSKPISTVSCSSGTNFSGCK